MVYANLICLEHILHRDLFSSVLHLFTQYPTLFGCNIPETDRQNSQSVQYWVTWVRNSSNCHLLPHSYEPPHMWLQTCTMHVSHHPMFASSNTLPCFDFTACQLSWLLLLILKMWKSYWFSSSRTRLVHQFLNVIIKQLLGNILDVHIWSEILSTHPFYSQETICFFSSRKKFCLILMCQVLPPWLTNCLPIALFPCYQYKIIGSCTWSSMPSRTW